jgi:hypothetical protein
MPGFHAQFLELVDRIEKTFPVADWQVGDVSVWPLARAALYLDMYWQSVGRAGGKPQDAPKSLAARFGRIAADTAAPLIHAWKSHEDLGHMVLRPRRADAVFLGDGVSLDRIDGAWRDRFCDPVIAALESKGRSAFLMQSGDLSRQPWARPTFTVNGIDRWGRRAAKSLGLATRLSGQFPWHADVVEFLARNGAPVQALTERALRQRAAVVSATASGFERVLKIVRPAIGFVVTYYAGMGHALVLACRRRGVLSVDLQHAPQGGQHEAYRWLSVPDHGYSVLPAVFWTWTEEDAASIAGWTAAMKQPWHRSLHGGHTQLPSWFDDENPQARAFDARIGEIRARSAAEREILVALQNLDGYGTVWDALARLIERAPVGWRWWLRRHPASLGGGHASLARLLSLRQPNVVIEEASSLPLPALLRHMHVVLSLRSGAAVEGAMFGVKPIFLSEEASGSFARLIETGTAEIVPDMKVLEQRIAEAAPRSRARLTQPALPTVLARLDRIAEEYAALRRNA